MSMVSSVVSAMETILGKEIESLAAKHDVIQRKRKFTGQTLLQMIVLTLMKNPEASYAEMALTAAQLGVKVCETAVKKRFTQRLDDFLRDVVSLAIEQVVAAEPVNVELLARFTAVEIGDSSSMKLPDALKDRFPGCGGNTEASGLAAIKIQVRWDLKTGALPQILIETGRSSDAKSPITQQEPLAGSLEIFDLGYFSLERFQNLDDKGAYSISRLQHGTHILDEKGIALDLQQFLSQGKSPEVIDTPILLGAHHQLPTRMIAVPSYGGSRQPTATKSVRKSQKTWTSTLARTACIAVLVDLYHERSTREVDLERGGRAVPNQVASGVAFQALEVSQSPR